VLFRLWLLQACYQLMEPGDYKISVLLTGLDYSASLESRNLGKERFPVELVKEVTVSAQSECFNSSYCA